MTYYIQYFNNKSQEFPSKRKVLSLEEAVMETLRKKGKYAIRLYTKFGTPINL